MPLIYELYTDTEATTIERSCGFTSYCAPMDPRRRPKDLLIIAFALLIPVRMGELTLPWYPNKIRSRVESRSTVMYNDERPVAECPPVIVIVFEMCGFIGRSHRVVERTHYTHNARCLRELAFRLSLV